MYSIVAHIIFNSAGSHLEIRKGGWFSELAPLPLRISVKIVSIKWISIVLNFPAILFDRTRLLSKIWSSSSYIYKFEVNDRSPLPPPIVNSGLKTASINWDSIVVNCAVIISDRTCLLSQIWTSYYNM